MNTKGVNGQHERPSAADGQQDEGPNKRAETEAAQHAAQRLPDTQMKDRSAFEGDAAEPADAADNTREMFSQLMSKMDILAGKVDALDGNVSGMRQDVIKLQREFTDLSARVGACETKQAQLDSEASLLSADKKHTNQRIDNLDGSLSIMDKDIAVLKKAVSSLDAFRKDAKKMQSAATARLDALEPQMTQVQKQAPAHKVDSVAQDLEMAERERRKLNLVMRGLKEDPGETACSLLATCQEQFDAETTDKPPAILHSAVRIGKPLSGVHRPVLLVFRSLSDRYAAWSYSRSLKSHGLKLMDDLTIKQQTVKRQLQGKAQSYFHQGRKPHWKGCRLFYTGENGTVEEELPPPPGLSNDATRPSTGSTAAAAGHLH